MTQPFDYDAVDARVNDAAPLHFPIAQWLHGQPRLAALGGVPHTGGVVLPAKYLPEGVTLPGWTRRPVNFESGQREDALSAARVAIAVLRTRFRWFVRQEGVQAHFPRAAYESGRGMRGHLQVLCAVYGHPDPIVITFKGKASQQFETLQRDFAGKVLGPANRAAPAGQRLPAFAFWMTVVPGPHTKAGAKGQESIITPPSLDLPDPVSDEYLQRVYVGREALLRFQALWHESEPWAALWDRPASVTPGFALPPNGAAAHAA